MKIRNTKYFPLICILAVTCFIAFISSCSKASPVKAYKVEAMELTDSTTYQPTFDKVVGLHTTKVVYEYKVTLTNGTDTVNKFMKHSRRMDTSDLYDLVGDSVTLRPYGHVWVALN